MSLTCPLALYAAASEAENVRPDAASALPPPRAKG